MSKILRTASLSVGLIVLMGCTPSGTGGNNQQRETSLGYAIVDTDQTLCYNSNTGTTQTCGGIGYDADYSDNQPDYSITDAGLTVTDNVTDLVWQRSTDSDGNGSIEYADKMTQAASVTYCDNLSLAGQTDWRLPSIKEAYSIILFSGEDASKYAGDDTSLLVPFISSEFDWAFGDKSAGDRLIDAQYATTSLYVWTTMDNDATMFGVNYVDGRIKGYPTAMKEFYVRCVRGNTDYGINDFVDVGDGTVNDNATGLMWQQSDGPSTNWDNAISICEAANTAAYEDWRLPNVKELQSILDYSRSPDTHGTAAIDPVFSATSFLNEESIADWGYYWASTTHVDYDSNGKNATYVSFGRALGFFGGSIKDVHGAGSQRSNDKVDVSASLGATLENDYYYKGPQGDILRDDNKVRCVRTI